VAILRWSCVDGSRISGGDVGTLAGTGLIRIHHGSTEDTTVDHLKRLSRHKFALDRKTVQRKGSSSVPRVSRWYVMPINQTLPIGVEHGQSLRSLHSREKDDPMYIEL